METSIKLTTDTKRFNQLLPRQQIPTKHPVVNQYSQLHFNNQDKLGINRISLETLKFEKNGIRPDVVEDIKYTNKQKIEFAAKHLPPKYDQSLKLLLTQKEFKKISHVHGALRSIINANLKGELIGKLKDFQLAENNRLADSYTIIDEHILVDITTGSDPTETVEALGEIHGIEINAMASTPAYSIISVAATGQSLFEMCLIPSLKSATPFVAISDRHYNSSLNKILQDDKPVYPQSQGSANNQAEDALEVNALKRIFSGITGTGISLGTMSDSINQVGNGIADSQVSNDLPANGFINVLSDTGGRDEGRAMMELIYDISPGLDTYGYATASTGAANMASNITALSNAGMDIIVDDIIYFNEPNFQDGVIDIAIQSFVNQGGSYFTAAGNRANQSYEATYNALSSYHNYSNSGLGDIFMQVTIPAGGSISVFLQWAEPWGSATSNLDLELWDGLIENRLRLGGVNNIGGIPFETVSYTNNLNTSFTANIAVKRVSGSNPIFKFIIAGPIVINQFLNGATGTMKPYSRYGIATGAAPWFSRDIAENFSSIGPITRYFDSQGNPITKLTINKPNYMSIDGGNTSFFGSDITEDGDTLPNFFGTSAAAPNAAAVAALMLQVAGGSGSLNQNEIRDLLTKSAIDLGDTGFDTTYGAGRINALGAVMLARGADIPENSLYLNQYGDAQINQNLLAITDVDAIIYASNDFGTTTIDINESDTEFDPMMAVFIPSFDFKIGVDYNNGPGDDASLSFTNLANVPHVFEIFSETMFTGTTGYTATVNAPDQQVTDRTANLDTSGDDLNISSTISSLGQAKYFKYTAPFSGSLDIGLITGGFNGVLRVYDNAGTLLNSTSSNNGILEVLTTTAIISGNNYYIQIVPERYIGTGNFSLSVNFEKQIFQLQIFKSGNGSGLVHSGTTPGINCGMDCLEGYEEGQILTLQAVPSVGHTFVGWSGAVCTPSGNTCSVSMDIHKMITAEFTAPDSVFKDGFE